MAAQVKTVTLEPVSRASLRLSPGGPVSTLESDGQDGAGPRCPNCGATMRPMHEPTLVRCENELCSWYLAPFRSSIPAARPVKVESTLEEAL